MEVLLVVSKREGVDCDKVVAVVAYRHAYNRQAGGVQCAPVPVNYDVLPVYRCIINELSCSNAFQLYRSIHR